MLSSNTSGVSEDANYIESVFSTYLYTGNGAAQTINNGIALGSAYGGSVYFDGTGDYLRTASTSAAAFGTGDFTMEAWVNPTSTPATYRGLLSTYDGTSGVVIEIVNGAWMFWAGAHTTSGVTAALGIWTHVAISRSGSTLRFFVNGALTNTISNSTSYGSSPITVGSWDNVGGFDFNGFISNARIVVGTAIYTSAFTPGTAPLTAITNTSLLTCQSPSPTTDYSTNALSITVTNAIAQNGGGPFTDSAATKGGMVWIKSRSNAVAPDLFDTARGAGHILQSSNTAADTYTADTQKTLTAFNADGFSLGTDSGNWGANFSGYTYASWTFRKQPKFFDVVTYTGNDTAGRTIAHSLGSVPGAIIVKAVSGAASWGVYHRSIGGTGALILNSTGATQTDSGYWNNTDPTSTVFTVGDNNIVNSIGVTYIAYLFAHDAGGFGLTGTDNVISCGSYTGTSANGNVVSLGYEPQWIMIKRTDSATNNGWVILDTMRGGVSPANADMLYLLANSSGTGSNENVGISSTGFFLNGSSASINVSGGTYIYIAIRRGPMKVPTDATKVFAPVTYTGNSANRSITAGFPVDFAMVGNRGSAASKFVSAARLTGNPFLVTSDTAAESADTAVFQANPFDNQTSVNIGAGNSRTNLSGSTYVLEAFRRAPSFFDEVCYTGDGLASRTVAHNLGVVPELIIVKTRDGEPATGDWIVYHKDLTQESATKKYWLILNSTNAQATSPYGGLFSGTANQSATAFKFTNDPGFLGYYYYNYTGKKYVSYLFATCDGVSKVGSYTGTGTTKQVDCGFAAGARFVLIKKTSGTGSWYVWDSARGIVSGNDPYLLLNSTAAEVTSTDYIDTYAAGFEISSTAPSEINENGGSFIFLAIA